MAFIEPSPRDTDVRSRHQPLAVCAPTRVSLQHHQRLARGGHVNNPVSSPILHRRARPDDSYFFLDSGGTRRVPHHVNSSFLVPSGSYGRGHMYSGRWAWSRAAHSTVGWGRWDSGGNHPLRGHPSPPTPPTCGQGFAATRGRMKLRPPPSVAHNQQ